MVSIPEKNHKKSINDLIGVFYKPIIVFPGGWHDTLPEWVLQDITIERIMHEMKIHKGMEKAGRVNELEAMAYLYTASLSIPFNSDYESIYIHVAVNELTKRDRKIPQDFETYKEFDSYRLTMFDDLKRWIWDAQEREYQKRLREDRRVEREKGKDIQEKKGNNYDNFMQVDLFT